MSARTKADPRTARRRGIVGLVAVVVAVGLGLGLAWHRHAGEERAAQGEGARGDGAAARDDRADGGARTDAGPRLPESDVHVLEPLVRPTPTAVPGTVAFEPGADGGAARALRWELAFPEGVWSLRFLLGSPDVELRFLDVSGAIGPTCHALSARTERGPVPFPAARFDADARTATLADMPLEVVEALSRTRDLTLVACDTAFSLDDAQQRVLIAFYVQATGLILDAVGAEPDAGVAGP